MVTTINISLSKDMYEDAKAFLTRRGYTSMSEFVRDALRKTLYKQEEITENGFTPAFEDAVLAAAAEPRKKDKVWKTEENIDTFFNELDKKLEKKRHGKS